VVEPVYEDGSVGPLTVVNLNHVVMAYYDESPPDVVEAAGVEDTDLGAVAGEDSAYGGEVTPA
jgi:hypothetical protein